MKSTGTLKIRPDLYAEFDQLSRRTNIAKLWTPETDEIILQFFKKTKRKEFLKAFAKRFFPVSLSALTVHLRKLQGRSEN